jgi:hypothetical protein
MRRLYHENDGIDSEQHVAHLFELNGRQAKPNKMLASPKLNDNFSNRLCDEV